MAQRPPAGCASSSTEAAQTRSAPGKEVGGLRQHTAGEQEAAEAGPFRPGPYRLGRSAAAGRAGAGPAAGRCPPQPPSRPWRRLQRAEPLGDRHL